MLETHLLCQVHHLLLPHFSLTFLPVPRTQGEELGREVKKKACQLLRNLLQRKKKGILRKTERKRRRTRGMGGRTWRKEVRFLHQMAPRIHLPACLLWMGGTQKMPFHLLLQKRLQGEKNRRRSTLFLTLLPQRCVGPILLFPCPLLKGVYLRKAEPLRKEQRWRMGKRRKRNKVLLASRHQAFQGSQADSSSLSPLLDQCWKKQRNSL